MESGEGGGEGGGLVSVRGNVGKGAWSGGAKCAGVAEESLAALSSFVLPSYVRFTHAKRK